MDKEDEFDLQVGYGRPPKSGQFQKGRSGNPKGRPKGSKSLAGIVLKECRQFVRVNGPGGTRKVTKVQAALMQLSNKSAQGDLRATRELLTLIQRAEETTDASTLEIVPSETDARLIQSLRKRFKKMYSSPVEALATEEERD